MRDVFRLKEVYVQADLSPQDCCPLEAILLCRCKANRGSSDTWYRCLERTAACYQLQLVLHGLQLPAMCKKNERAMRGLQGTRGVTAETVATAKARLLFELEILYEVRVFFTIPADRNSQLNFLGLLCRASLSELNSLPTVYCYSPLGKRALRSLAIIRLNRFKTK